MPDNLSCIIVDSDDGGIQQLSDRLRSLYNSIKIRSTYSLWSSVIPVLPEQKYDIIFIDISIAGLTGDELRDVLSATDSELIFVTAHPEYALASFKLLPSGFVLKPIDDRELVTAVDKAIERINNKKIARQTLLSTSDKKIGLPNKKGVDYISLHDIIYAVAINNCTDIITLHTRLACSYNITKLKMALEHEIFYPIHRSYIVNMNYISRYAATGCVIMSNGFEIPISKVTKDHFFECFERLTKNKL